MRNRTLIILFLITCILLTITLLVKTTHSLITDITNENINNITLHDLVVDREGVYKEEFDNVVNELSITYDEANILMNSKELNNLLTEILNNSYDYHYANKPKLTNRYIYNKIVASVNHDINIDNELKNKVITKSEEFINDITNYLYNLEITKDINK